MQEQTISLSLPLIAFQKRLFNIHGFGTCFTNVLPLLPAFKEDKNAERARDAKGV